MNYYILIPMITLSISSHAQDVLHKYDFGEGDPAAGFIKVSASTIYSPESGYGLDYQSKVIAKRTGNKHDVTDDHITSSRPFYFSVKLPEGNYNIAVTSGDALAGSVTTIKAECRRLMVERLVTKKGQFLTTLFTVHIRDSIIRNTPGSKVKLKPRERKQLHWDDKLTLEFNNTAPKICAITITPVEDIPTIFLAGNSTVVDQAEEPWAAWGQMFPAFMKGGKISVANYAESGETLKGFKSENRLKKIWSMAKPGDYLFIEFAHNDQKHGGNYLDPFTTYQQTLKEWIAEARERKIIPVLVTSMNRRNFDSSTGKIINTLGDYPEAMRQLGKAENVTVLDLNMMSKVMYEAWGPERSLKAFVHFPANTYPNQPEELKDNTHFSAYGAYELAKCIVQAISISALDLKNFISPAFKSFHPTKPDTFESFSIPPSPVSVIEKPDGS